MRAYAAATTITAGATNAAPSRHRGLRSARLSTINAVNPAASAANAVSGFEINEKPANNPARTVFGVAFRVGTFKVWAFGVRRSGVKSRKPSAGRPYSERRL